MLTPSRSPAPLQHRGTLRHATLSPGAATIAALILSAAVSSPALANNYGERFAWQFQSAKDRAAQAAILDVIERRRARVYHPPVYTTNIARQVDCSNSAVATGNNGAQSALANSPTVTGASSSATATATPLPSATKAAGPRSASVSRSQALCPQA